MQMSLSLGNLNSYKQTQLWPFCQRRSVLAQRAQADSDTDRAVSNFSVRVSHGSKNSKRNVLFICFHITELCIDKPASQGATHPCSHGWKKAHRCFYNKTITCEGKRAFPSPLGLKFGDCVSSRDVWQKGSQKERKPHLCHCSIALFTAAFQISSGFNSTRNSRCNKTVKA